MKFPKNYLFLKNNHFSEGEFSIRPIRYEDRLVIMKWRNEQMYHLRQNELLTIEKQDSYYINVVSKLFEQVKPKQILFSYFKGDKCIGYGGLVHVNWIDRNAEVSFIMETKLDEIEFEFHWRTYLKLLEELAFNNLNLHKIYTYAFDLRPHLYEAIEKAGFTRNTVLKEHCYFEGVFKDVLIHSKYKNTLTLSAIVEDDIDFTYLLSSDPITRVNSYNQETIPYSIHEKWFDDKISNDSAFYFIGKVNRVSASFLRIDRNKEENVIGIALDKKFRGNKLASPFLKMITEKFIKEYKEQVVAYIKKENIASIKSFEKAGFVFEKDCEMDGKKSKRYVYES